MGPLGWDGYNGVSHTGYEHSGNATKCVVRD